MGHVHSSFSSYRHCRLHPATLLLGNTSLFDRPPFLVVNMALPPSFSAANARALWRATHTAVYCTPSRLSQQLARSGRACSSEPAIPAATARAKKRALSNRSRQLCWAEQKHQRQEFHCCCCSSWILRQQQRAFLAVSHNFMLALGEPQFYCCPAGPCGSLCAPDMWRFTGCRSCWNKRSCVKTSSSLVLPKFVGTSLQNATNGQQQPHKCHADDSKAGHSGATQLTDVTAKKKLANIMLLRRRSGGVSAGECVKALKATNGDMEAAAVQLRKQGLSRAAARRGATSREGLVAVGIAEDPREPGNAAPGRKRTTAYALVALTSETDFVAANARFVALAQQVARTAARESTAGDALRGCVVDTKQQATCMSVSVPEAEWGSSCSVQALPSASLLEAIQAAPVSESLLTLGAVEGTDIPRPAGKAGSSASDAGAPQRVNGAILDNRSTIVQDSRSDNGTMSVSSALALLSHQFGEDVQLSDVKSVVVEQRPPQLRHDQVEYESERCTSRSNAAVGVYVHGRVAKDVGRAAALVCLRWHSEEARPSSHTAAADVEQPLTKKHWKIERLAQLLCMQVVATQPRYVKLSDISESERDAARRILAAACAANASKTRVQESSMNTPPGRAAAHAEFTTSSVADAARGSRCPSSDYAVEARLEGMLREQTLLEQEFLPLSRFRAEILAFDGMSTCSIENSRDRNCSSNIPSSSNSSDISVPRVSASTGNIGGNTTAVPIHSKLRLTVKDAIKQAAAALHCSTIEVESVQFLAVGSS